LERHGRIDEVWHLAANSDIPAGVDDPSVDLKDTFMTTFWLLEACRKFGVKKFNFASSSAVYGDWSGIPLSETLGPLKPISNYGAMKLASEAQICAAIESYLDVANIFRFPNVVGVPATHGVILDFFIKLITTPKRLDILGDGSQKKSYLHVSELINAMVFISTLENKTHGARVVNVGCDDSGILVSEIAQIVTSICSPNAKLEFGKTNRGWIGDVPKFSYDISYLKSLGWEPKLSSREAVEKAASEINKQFGRG
jgi:UDP-glucose 4-epimerase